MTRRDQSTGMGQSWSQERAKGFYQAVVHRKNVEWLRKRVETSKCSVEREAKGRELSKPKKLS